MRSNSGLRPGRWRQSGSTLIEPLVASVLLGVGVVAALTAIDVGTVGAGQAVARARAQCLVRTEAEYVEAAPYVPPDPPGSSPRRTYHSISTEVTVKNDLVDDSTVSPLARVTITHTDPKTGSMYSIVVMKAQTLSIHGPNPSDPPSVPCK